uniref:Trimethylamine methyltransferase n=1 Tax=Parastrongyloides trichosuri TaxID=131310 RepID=A0A0N5A1L5_PARTI
MLSRITRSFLRSRLITFRGYSTIETKEVLLKENENKGIPFVRKITEELEKKDIKYILPIHDNELMLKIAKPFDYLTKIGMKPEFILDACLYDPLFMKVMVKNGDLVIKILDILVEMTCMTYENAIRLFTVYKDDLLAVDSNSIISRLQVFINVGINEGEELCKVVCKCPVILFSGDPMQSTILLESLANFFTRNQIKAIVKNSPQIIFKNFEEIEEKYEYIYFLMGIESEEFKFCKTWVDMPLDEIIKRHEFLMKCGRYVTPDPKRLQLQKENPPLYRILDTNDNIFATQVGGVTVEEWYAYETLHEKMKELEKKDKPFERIKPSMRKAYERRIKKGLPKNDFIIE